MAETITSPKLRFYKFVTGPKNTGATIVIGDKQVAGADFSQTLNAINSLGATVNSIGVLLQNQLKAQQAQAAEIQRQTQFVKDQQSEQKIEDRRSNIGERIGGIIQSVAPSFLEYLSRLLKSLLIYGALDWLSKPENTNKIKVMFERIGAFFKGAWEFFNKTINFIGGAWNQTFGDGNDWLTRIKGAVKLIGVAGAALLGLGFLKNPLGTIKAFGNVLKLVGGGVMNLGKFLGGNVIGRAIQSAVQGVMAYQDVMGDESIPQERRQAAAVGAGAGATIGGTALGAIGNSIAGPIGGMIGNALGGFLGKEAGKFFGPIVGDFFNAIGKIFKKIGDVINAFLKPLTDAIRDFFKALGPAIDKIVNWIKPHMPGLLKVAEFMGNVVFGPLIMMMKAVTNILKWITGTGPEDLVKGIKSSVQKGQDAVGAGLDALGNTFTPPARAAEAAVGSEDANRMVSSMGFTSDQWATFRETVGSIESGGRYNISGGSGGKYDGRYQLGADAKTDAAKQLGVKNPGHNAAARDAFRKNPGMQEAFFAAYTKANHNYLMGKDKYRNASPERKLQILGYAHNQGMGGASDWLSTGKVGADGFGTKGTKYTDAIAAAFKSRGRSASRGGWISGPMSGYPVSLTGKTVDFIGHGTEYVAKRSAGGFVIPFDTPDTRKNPGLTAKRMQEARSGGYLKSAGGPIPEMSLGGFFKSVGNMIGGAVNKVAPVVKAITPVASAILPGAAPGLLAGQKIIDMVQKVQQTTAQVEAANLEGAIKMIVLDVIEAPGIGGGGGGEAIPIVQPQKANPANKFLQSRFGFMGEASTILSNFF
jgi:hypothetical protein